MPVAKFNPMRPATVSLLTADQYRQLRERVARIENAQRPGWSRKWHLHLAKAVK